MTQVKPVINWLIDQKHLPADSKFRDPLSKPQGSSKFGYGREHVLAMLEHCDADPTLVWMGRAIRMLACTGLRREELVGLRWSDVDPDGA